MKNCDLCHNVCDDFKLSRLKYPLCISCADMIQRLMTIKNWQSGRAADKLAQISQVKYFNEVMKVCDAVKKNFQ